VEAKTYAALLGICLTLSAALTAEVKWGDAIPDLDARVNRWFENNSSDALRRFFEIVTHAGTFWGLLVVCIAVGALLVRGRHWPELALLVAAFAGALVLYPLAKSAIARPRPGLHDPHIHLTSSSYPSGHATGTAAVYGAIAVIALRLLPPKRAWIVVAACAVGIIVVGVSRVYLGAHYVTDVLGGVLLGTSWLLVCLTADALLAARRGRGNR
jgi:undecaprenyl-diphosphatase